MGFGGIFGVCIVACWAAALVFFDVAFRRLPNALTVPAAFVALIICCVSPFMGHPETLWALLWPSLYFLSPAGVGGGDVKLAMPLAVMCVVSGGLPALLLAVGVSGLLTGLAAWLCKRQVMAHGPSMIMATWLAVMYFGV